MVLIGTIVMLFGCSGYVNHYSAMMLITSSHGNEASMEFDTFDLFLKVQSSIIIMFELNLSAIFEYSP